MTTQTARSTTTPSQCYLPWKEATTRPHHSFGQFLALPSRTTSLCNNNNSPFTVLHTEAASRPRTTPPTASAAGAPSGTPSRTPRAQTVGSTSSAAPSARPKRAASGSWPEASRTWPRSCPPTSRATAASRPRSDAKRRQAATKGASSTAALGQSCKRVTTSSGRLEEEEEEATPLHCNNTKNFVHCFGFKFESRTASLL